MGRLRPINMQIQVESNPNCEGSEQFVFRELEAPRWVRGIKVSERGKEIECGVVGVEEGGRFIDAQAVKITDSGAGFAYLISGGRWGIRLRPSAHAAEPWDLENKHQWGEPFKIYGNSKDIIYSETSS